MFNTITSTLTELILTMWRPGSVSPLSAPPLFLRGGEPQASAASVTPLFRYLQVPYRPQSHTHHLLLLSSLRPISTQWYPTVQARRSAGYRPGLNIQSSCELAVRWRLKACEFLWSFVGNRTIRVGMSRLISANCLLSANPTTPRTRAGLISRRSSTRLSSFASAMLQ